MSQIPVRAPEPEEENYTLSQFYIHKEIKMKYAKNEGFICYTTYEQKRLRRKGVRNILTIVSQRGKLLSTFDKFVNLYDRIFVSGRYQITNENYFYLAVVCYDIIQRANEVTYIGTEELLHWIDSKSIDKNMFNKLRHDIYSNTVFMAINSTCS